MAESLILCTVLPAACFTLTAPPPRSTVEPTAGAPWVSLQALHSYTSITVSATNLCPANYALPNGGWCGPGRPHFDMSQPAWEHIGVYQAGVIPVVYQQVKCSRSGSVRFSIGGCNYFLASCSSTFITVGAAWIKGENTGWIQMSRNWGANWQALAGLVGQGLSFAVTSTGGQYIQFLNIVPAWWQFGQTYTTYQNFYH